MRKSEILVATSSLTERMLLDKNWKDNVFFSNLASEKTHTCDDSSHYKTDKWFL